MNPSFGSITSCFGISGMISLRIISTARNSDNTFTFWSIRSGQGHPEPSNCVRFTRFWQVYDRRKTQTSKYDRISLDETLKRCIKFKLIISSSQIWLVNRRLLSRKNFFVKFRLLEKTFENLLSRFGKLNSENAILKKHGSSKYGRMGDFGPQFSPQFLIAYINPG